MFDSILWLDSETRSTLSLTTSGTARYATVVETIMVSWALGDEPPQVWEPLRQPMPDRFVEAVLQCDMIVAHNAFFDYTTLMRQPWWRALGVPLSMWRCSMATALAHGLPGGLEQLCQIFNISEDEAKVDGKEFINLFCKPNKQGGFNDWTTHPAEWKGFRNYAKRDIPSMRAVFKKLPKWNQSPFELALWQLDQEINHRGFAVDVDLAESAVRAVTAEKKRLNDRTSEMTHEMLDRTTQRDKMLGYLLLEYGVELPDLRTDTVERRLDDPELPEHVKELLRIRLKASKSSATKYKRILQMHVAGRMYGCLQYCGANRTKRWGGRNFQPQNLPRPKLKQAVIEMAIEALKAGAETVSVDDIMEAASSSLRGVIVAASGKKLCISDLSNIEGRKVAWLADEEWKLQAFRDFDAGIGSDLYKVSYARSFDVDPEDVNDGDQRQIGKVQELALGYEGGVNAFVTMAMTYRMDLDELAEKAWPTLPTEYRLNAQELWKWASRTRRTYGLPERVYCVCEALKCMWRDAHPGIVALWSQVQSAAICATENPGKEFHVNGKLTFDRKGAWLRCKLPSGGYLCYPSPKVVNGSLSYMGVNAYSRKWHRIYTYGGKLVENITQASSRDVMAHAMIRIKAAGYPIVLTVHDEVMCETPDTDRYTAKHLSTMLATNDAWNVGLPLAAKGFETYRYRKD